MTLNTTFKRRKDRDLKKIRKITELADICYVRQKEQNGLGAAIKCGERHLGDEPFAVLLGDSITKGPTPCTKQLIDVYNKYNASAISLEEVPQEKVERYGIISGSEVEKDIYKIKELVEKPPRDKAPSNLAIMGRYVLTPDIFDKIDKTDRELAVKSSLPMPFKNWIQFMESHLKAKPMTLETGLNGSRHQSSLHWMTMNSKMIWSVTWKATFRC